MNASPVKSALPEGLTAAIDRTGEIPIGVQLAWALRSCVRDGRVSPGERLPGLRELAEAVGVNANTVRSVYQRLEREGLIESRQGSGTFVSELPAGAGAASSTVTTIAADAAREALAAGADPREVAAALYVAPGTERASGIGAKAGEGADADASATTDTGAGTGADASASTSANASTGADTDVAAAAHRRALRAQIATLERAIGAMEAEHPGVAPPPDDATRSRGGPALLSAEELELVRSGLVHRLAAVQAAIDVATTAGIAGVGVGAGAGDRARSTDGRARARRQTADTPASARSTGKRPRKPPTTGVTGPTPRPAAAGT